MYYKFFTLLLPGLIIVSFATLLVGISPDNISKYSNALEEINELKKLSNSLSTTYNFVVPEVPLVPTDGVSQARLPGAWEREGVKKCPG